MRGKIKLIANPIAGRGAEEKIRQAQVHIERRGHTVDLSLTGARGDAMKAAAAAKEADFDRIIAAGGDGTLNEVVNGLAPSDIPLAFLPLGTTNVFALEVGIPFDVDLACQVALEGAPRRVCLGKAGDTRFLLMAGIGFDAATVCGVSTRLKRWTGKLAYVASALIILVSQPPSPIEVLREDGTVMRGYGAVIGNCRLYAGRFSVTPEASPLEDVLDVCLFLKGGRLQLLHYAAKVVAGRRLEPPGVQRFKARQLTVCGAGAPVQVDGDCLGRLPMTFRAVSGELTMVLPPGA